MPKGIYFSSLVMTFPLAFLTLNLLAFAPFAANPELINPEYFQYMARAALRLLSLNLAFIGGVHYGLGAAMYEIAIDEKDFQFNKYQMIYSMMPATIALAATSFMLFASPLTIKHVVFGFSSLMMT